MAEQKQRGATVPTVQVALDFLEIERAMKCAREAVAGGAKRVEAGTPLIKSEGLDSVRQLWVPLGMLVERDNWVAGRVC